MDQMYQNNVLLISGHYIWEKVLVRIGLGDTAETSIMTGKFHIGHVRMEVAEVIVKVCCVTSLIQEVISAVSAS